MPVLAAIVLVLLLAYTVLIVYYFWAWNRIPEISGGAVSPPAAGDISVSVIVPARNESASIGACLDALLAQRYPAFLTEIVVIDDHSTDDTAAIALAKGCRVLDLATVTGAREFNSFKKKAIEAGIDASTGDWIVCTDADCSADKNWLRAMVPLSTGEAVMRAGPVRIRSNGSALGVFQALDVISLQGITGAAVTKRLYPMANGANLAYARSAFEMVDGFSGIDTIASGDDMLLMKKMQDRFPGKQGYVKDRRAIVSTDAAVTLKDFFRQRVRWASKTAHYGHPPTVATLALVYALNLGLLVLFIHCFFGGEWIWLLALLAGKTIVEMPFVGRVARFFGQGHLMVWFPVCQPFHIFYTVVAGTFGSFGKVQWKGRQVR